MAHPFRFGVQISALPREGWQEAVRRIESLGYSTLFLPDHFGKQWDPTTALAAIAAVSDQLKVGSLVYDVDYRHPVVYAKAAATLHLLSGGRHEFGIGAGWMETDYVQAGMPYDRPGVRIGRLEEALQIIVSMWQNESTSFEGEHYNVRDIAQAASLRDGERPRVLIGGGGKRLLSLAGRYADIVGINPAMVDGKITAATPADSTPERAFGPAAEKPLTELADARDAVALGPGLGREAHLPELVGRLVRSIERPLVIDADGLNALHGQLEILRERRAATILTPPSSGWAPRTIRPTGTPVNPPRRSSLLTLSTTSKTPWIPSPRWAAAISRTPKARRSLAKCSSPCSRP